MLWETKRIKFEIANHAFLSRGTINTIIIIIIIIIIIHHSQHYDRYHHPYYHIQYHIWMLPRKEFSSSSLPMGCDCPTCIPTEHVILSSTTVQTWFVYDDDYDDDDDDNDDDDNDEDDNNDDNWKVHCILYLQFTTTTTLVFSPPRYFSGK